ncbi:MAG: hypothetical protein ACE5EB_08265 [Thermodesulfobacteriota bacterium]
MIIDGKKPEFEDLPVSLDGEVLLERVFGEGGSLMGFITASPDVVREMKGRTPRELKERGWDKYKVTLENLS